MCRRGWSCICRGLSVAAGATLVLVAVSLLAGASGASAESYEEVVEGTSGIAHFWPMGEISGPSFADVVGSDNASLVGGVSLGEPGGLVGDTSTSALFDGSSGAAHAPVDLSGSEKLTVEFWMKWPVFGDNDALALEFTPNFNENAGGFLVDPNAYEDGGTFGIGVGEGASRNNAFFAQPSAEAWHYYAFVIDTEGSGSTEITPYVDGKAMSYSKTESGTGGGFADSTLYWMSRDASSLFGEGAMQDLALYDTTLSSGAILEHYEIGKGGPTASFASSPLVATAGVPVRLDASESSSPGGSLTDYAWDFDGSKSYATDGGGSASESHTFSSPGTYTVDLRVKDSLGETATTSQTITVGVALGAYEQAVESNSEISHFWPMGESSGSSFADVFAGANASVSGGVSLGEPGALVEDPSTSASFDGSSGAAHAPVDLSGSGKETVEFWMKWKAYASDDHLALEFTPNFNENAGGFLVDPDAPEYGGKFGVGVGEGGSRNNVFFARPSAGAWHYYAFVINTEGSGATEITPYVDGKAVSYAKSESGTGGGFANSTLYWMSRDASSLFGAGDMQDLALYRGALSSSTILKHYAIGEGGPKASFTYSPISATVGVPVRLDASSSSSPGGSLLDYAWDFNGSKTYSINGGSSASESHTFSSPGTYTVDLQMKDGLGETATTSQTITVGPALGQYEQAVEETAGVAHFWPMGESSGSSFADLVGGDNATLEGGVTLGQTGALVEDSSTSALFNGSSGAAHAPVALSDTHQLTVEFWMKWKAYAGDDRLALEFTPNFNEHPGGFLVDPDATPGSDFAVSIGQGTSRNTVFFERPSAEAWHYYAFAIDTAAAAETEITPYVDGHTVSYTKSESGAGAGNFADSTLYWMSRDAGSLFGAGDMQDLALYEGALGAETILAHYERGENTYRVVNTVPPSVEGTAEYGHTLTATTGTWSGATPLSYAYQWQNCNSLGEGCLDIAGATASSHTLGPDELGSTMRVVVTATNAAGSVSSVSSVTSGVSASVPIYLYAGQFGSEGTGPGQFEGLADIAVGPHGDLWVLDYLNDRVERFNAAGEYLGEFGSSGSSPGELSYPSGLTVDPKGNVWVADTKNDRIEEFNEKGEYENTVGSFGLGDGELHEPEGVAVDQHGNLWISDTVNNRLEVFNEKGEFLKIVGTKGTGPGQFKEPEGIAIDAHGNVWVADYRNNRVEEFNEAGEYIRQFGSEGSEDGQLKHPNGVTVDSEDNVWVGDTGNNRIEGFNEEGEYISQFGSYGSRPGNFDFGSSMGLATGSNGTIWVTDVHNYRIEKWALPGAPANTTPPSVSGQSTVGGTLIAHLGVWSGAPAPSYVYQWQSCNSSGGECEDIDGATKPSYALTSAEVEATLRVRVTATNTYGSVEVTSAAGSPVLSDAPDELEAPSIAGQPRAGETLDADPGLWGGIEAEVSYQWEKCNATGGECADIVGAIAAEYELGEGDVGATLRLRVGASNELGSVTALSPATPVIGTASLTPASSLGPSLSGTVQSGQVLTVSSGAWTGVEPLIYTYRWKRCDPYGSECEERAEQHGSSYVLREGDVGHTVRVVMTATDTDGSLTQAASTEQPVASSGGPRVTEAPSMVGAPVEGRTLQANPGTWSGSGAIGYAYQWERCGEDGEHCTAIEGATGDSYTLTAADLSSAIRLAVTASEGSASSLGVSPPTPTIGTPAPLDRSTPSIAGVDEIGEPLSADPGIWSGEGAVSYSYQWRRCNEAGGSCADISGATETTYVAGASDEGKTLRVVVTASDPSGTASAASDASTPIASTPAVPSDVLAPSIEGALTAGDTLTAAPGTWYGSESISYGYQWQSCEEEGEECTNISGATGKTYVLGEAEVGSRIRVIVTASNSAGSESAESPTSEAVDAPGPPVAGDEGPQIRGEGKVGQRLFAENGSWSGSRPFSYSYRWERCNAAGEACTDIESATAPSYTAVSADANKTLRVAVTASNTVGRAAALSPTVAVAASGEASTTAAIELAEHTDPSVLQPSTSATLEEQEVKPATSDPGEELAATTTLTSSSVSKETPGEFAVNTPDGQLSFAPVGTASGATTLPTIVNGTAAVYAQTFNATDTIVRPEALGASALLQLRSAEAPRSFSWEVGLGPDQYLERLSDGSVAVVEAAPETFFEEPPGEPFESTPESTEPSGGEGVGGETAEEELEDLAEGESLLGKLPAAPETTTPEASPKEGELHPQDTEAQYEHGTSALETSEMDTGGKTLMVIQVPTVLDATGGSVSASLSVDGDTVTLAISPSEGTVYPVTAQTSIAAPTDQVSSARGHIICYGLSDPKTASFTTSEENGETVEHFDSHLKTGPMHVGTARLVLNYNAEPKNPTLEAWLEAVHKDGLQPYITLRECHPQEGYPACPSKTPDIGVYRREVKALIKGLMHGNSAKGIPPVSIWGAWNEPDDKNDPLHSIPSGARKAAHFWQVMRKAAKEVGCHCTVVAGEFTEYKRLYIEAYRKTILKGQIYWHGKPHVWGLHDYRDLKYFHLERRNSNAISFERALGVRLGHPHIWLSELGVELQDNEKWTSLVGHSLLQREAANDFLHMENGHGRIERQYYYLFLGPTQTEIEKGEKKHVFDSALLHGAGVVKEGKYKAENPRQAYCVLALGKNGCPAKSATLAPVAGTVGVTAGQGALTVDPGGLPSTFWVEYGATTAYGHSTVPGEVTDEADTQSEGIVLKGLAPCTTYHYQAEAENEANEGVPSLGGDQTFTTGGCESSNAAVDYSGGLYHSCAVLVGGSVECWGENSEGELGDGTRESSSTPVPVSRITDAIEVAAGADSSCALLSSDSVECWGGDGYGQLGDGATEESLIPVPVSGIADATQVAVGNRFACAIEIGGAVRCWGANEWGQLGDGTTTSSDAPVPVSGITDAVGISAGEHFACAALADGEVECWGDNEDGLGDGETAESSAPVRVSGITDAASVTVGENSACARLIGGQIECWGGETGHAGELESPIPVAVSGIYSASAFTESSVDHTCAVLSGGVVECWGVGPFGQLGNDAIENSWIPVAVQGLSGPAVMAGGGYHFSCALLASGGINCWGENAQDELGDGTSGGSLTPVPVAGIG